MGHGKLKKFAENETFRCLLQPAAAEVMEHGPGGALLLRNHPVKGRWNRDMFTADQPVVLELGCGKGEYTIALAERHPEMNFIGVDIKGARLWKGAKYATEQALPNVAFLRTRIEFIPAFFAPGEVSEIWLTFSDPQLKSPNSRLTSPLFLERYRQFLAPGGIVHLKTDSRFLHEYTRAVIAANGLPVLASGTDIYRDGVAAPLADLATSLTGLAAPLTDLAAPLTDLAAVFEVQTFYESMFLEMGLPITYLAFSLDRPAPAFAAGEDPVRPSGDSPFVPPTDFDEAYWREAEGPRRTFSHQPAKK